MEKWVKPEYPYREGDSETVYRVLVHVSKKNKKHRDLLEELGVSMLSGHLGEDRKIL